MDEQDAQYRRLDYTPAQSGSKLFVELIVLELIQLEFVKLFQLELFIRIRRFMTRLAFLSYTTRILKRTDKNTEIYEALNETIKDISTRHMFSEYSFQSYLQTTAEQEDYPLPTDLLHVKHPIRLLEGSATNDTGWVLTMVTKEEYDLMEPNPNRTNPSTGRPSFYCVYSNSILLTPIPDLSTYLIEINWANVPGSLDDDADTSSFNSVWDEIVKHGVLYRMFSLLGMYKEAQYYETRYERGIDRMTSNDKDRTGGHIFNLNSNIL